MRFHCARLSRSGGVPLHRLRRSDAAQFPNMENVVEGEEMDPAEFEKPGWATIRHRQKDLHAAEEASRMMNTPCSMRAAQQGRRRPPKRQPPASPLPASDVKIILRPRGGLALTSVAQATLADVIQAQAGLAPNQDDQIRIHQVANYVIISTPSEDRAKMYANINSLTLRGQQYEIAAHVSAPANTVVGVIFNIPEDDTPEQIMNSICNYNPDLKILDAKRLNSSNMVQILFDGMQVPYWIRYRATTYRCKPFRRKTEACTTCWQAGHRPDVCPNSSAQPRPRCSSCGTVNPAEAHPCSPRCIVCEGPHVTGTADCPKRFQPRRRPPTFAQIVTEVHNINRTPEKDSEFPRSQDKPKDHPTSQAHGAGPKTTTGGNSFSHRRRVTPPKPELNSGKQVSYPSASHHGSSHPLPPLPPSHDILKELNAIRAEMTLLRQENAALRQENQSLKQRITPHVEEAPSPSPNPPPPKRKAVADDSQSAPALSDREELVGKHLTAIEDSCKQALLEQKAEYSNFYQALQGNLSVVQANIEELRTELHNFMREIFGRINASTAPPAVNQPPYDPTYEQQ